MTKDTAIREQARAVFLAALMVLSVSVGTVALSGGAAATAGGASLSDSIAQPGEAVTISGNHDSETTLYVVADTGGDGAYTEADDSVYTIPDGDVSDADGTFETDVVPSDDLGLKDGDQVDIYVHENVSEPGDGTSLQSHAGTLTVDGSAPAFSGESPVDGAVINDVNQEISIDIADDVSASGDLSLSANVANNGDINTYEINPDSTTDDGVSFSSGTLTISPTGSDVPELEEGTVDVMVEVTDEAGNTNTTTFSFEVDLSDVSSSFDAPGDGAVTGDVNETVGVSLASEGAAINDETVTLDIEGPSGFTTQSYDYEDDAYDNASNTFTVTPVGDSIASFEAEGVYTVTVTGTTEAGNSVNDQYTFSVDTTGPDVSSTSINVPGGDEINSDEVKSEELNVTLGVNEPGAASVNASSVEAVIEIDGETVIVDDFESTNNGIEATVNDELAQFGAVENDTATINVTAASDTVGNELTNADGGLSETEFAIDTDGPSVDLVEDTPNDGEFSGYMNVSELIASTEDVKVSGLTVEVLVGGNAEAATQVGSPDNFDTTTLPDGQHVLLVTVEDDSGNTASAEEAFVLDNGDDVTVQQKYLAGTHGSYEVPIDGQLNLSEDVFSIEGDTDVTYTVSHDGNTVEIQDFDANDYENGDVVTLVANGVTVDVVVDRVELTSIKAFDGDTETYQNPSTVEFTFSSELTELNATLKATDGYDSVTWQDTLSDFEKVDNGDGTYTYVTDVPNDIRDGHFEVVVDDVETDTQTLDTSKTQTIVIDHGAPALTSAEVVDGDSDGLTVQVQFNESVTGLSGDSVSVEGVEAYAYVQSADSAEGVFQVTFDKEFQTADAPNITVDAGAVTEVYNVDAQSTNDETKTEIRTIAFDLEEGVNVISIPAETGSVAVDEYFGGDAVEGVFAYEGDGSWASYDADAKENDLSKLEGGNAYVVTVKKDTTVAINAENVPSDADKQAIQSQRVSEGWNLIGHYQEGSQSVEQALASLGDRTYSVQQGYTGTQVDTLETGEGYWLFVDENGYHVPVDYDGMNSERPTVYNVQVPDSVEDGQTDVTVSAEVDAPNPVSEVLVSSFVFGEPVELTDGDNDGVYDAKIDANYADDISETGDFGVHVSAIDIHGNVGEETSTVTATENVAPSITGYSVTNTDSQNVEVSFTTDEQLASVSASVSGAETGTLSGVGSDFSEIDNGDGTFTYTATYVGNSDGDYTITLDTAEDTAGNDGAGSESDSVTVDTTEPTVSNVQISDNTDSNGEVTTDDTVLITADVSDASSDVSSVTADASAFGAGSSVTLVDDGSGADDASSDGTYTATITVGSASAATEGDQSVTVSANDTAGNGGSQAVESGMLAVDTTTPTVSSVTLADDGSGNLDLTFDSDEQLGADASDIAVSVDGPNSGADTYTFTGDDFSETDNGDGSYTYTLTTTQAYDDGDGDYTATVDDATDAAGNNGGVNGDDTGLSDTYSYTAA